MRIDGLDYATLYYDADGVGYSREAAEDQLDRLEHRMKEYERQLSMRIDRATERRLRNKLERIDANHTKLWGQLHPAYSDQNGLMGGPFADGEIQRCRTEECPNALTRKRAFEQMGMCDTCWEIATTVHRAPNYERTDDGTHTD